jgi:hypothetical protein
VTGNTASTAGLTVSLVKEPGGGGEVCLEEGLFLYILIVIYRMFCLNEYYGCV